MTPTNPTFDPATFQEIAQKIADYIVKLGVKIDELASAVNDLLDSWALKFLGAVKDAIRWLAQKVIDLAVSTLEKIVEVNQAIWAPLTFWQLADGWGDNVQETASQTAAVVQPNALRAPLDWSGEAADRYKLAVSLQGPAATSVSSMGGTVALHLRIAAAGGLAFYGGLVIVAVKFVAVMVAALTATATGVGAPVGLGAAAGEAATDAAVIGGLIAAVTAIVSAEVAAFANIENAANNTGAFPGNAWPVGTA